MIFDESTLGPVLDVFESTKGVKQRKEYHPEEDLFSHLYQCMNWAFRETLDIELIIAAMLHDVGKKLVIESDNTEHGHERIASDILAPIISPKALWVIENHMRFWDYIDGSMRKLSKCRDFIEHPFFCCLPQLGRWDKLSRKPNYKIDYDRQKLIERFNKTAYDHY